MDQEEEKEGREGKHSEEFKNGESSVMGDNSGFKSGDGVEGRLKEMHVH